MVFRLVAARCSFSGLGFTLQGSTLLLVPCMEKIYYTLQGFAAIVRRFRGGKIGFY